MMDLDSAVEKLKAFGLMENAARVYLTLALKGPMGPSEIATVSGVARAEVHRHLRSLQNRGFCFLVVGKAGRYSAASAETVLSSVVEQERIRADLMTKKRDEILSHWASLQAHNKLAGIGSEKLQVLKDTEIALERGTKMVIEAKSVARAMLHTPTIKNYLSSVAMQSIENMKSFEARKGEKQAEIRVLAVSPPEETRNLRSIMNNLEFPLELNARWANSSELESLPDTIIKDEDEVLIRIIPATEQEQDVDRREIKAIWSNVRSLINPFITLFDENWNEAIRFDAGRASRSSVLKGDRFREEVSSTE
jgi:sugar-specific transcriptional regulator TrmB